MLVLSRKKNEGIIITVPPSTEPTIVEVVVVEVRGDKTRIGLTADEKVVIHRKEVQDVINQKTCGARTC